ncbi:MAG: hypothetical protein QOD35_679, partial [Nocardioidaceae bacterium]|nr:hypothetical protein [Nocardioidaceae bacterium]
MKLLRTTLAGACAAAVLVSPLAANAVTSPSRGATGPAAAVAAAHKTSIRFLDFDRVRAYGSDIH